MTTHDDSLALPKASLPIGLVILSLAAAVFLATGAYMAFFYAPSERIMGFIQKIFYFHVPAAWMMLLSVPLMAVGSIGYLITRRNVWDRISDAAVELAILFGVLVLVTGPLWGRKAWGVYWVWDVRLTSSLVLVLTLVACKIVRNYAGPSAKQVAAGLSVLAVLNAVFVWVSVDIWRGTHPPKLVATLEPRMKQTFWLCVLAFHLAYLALLWTRLRFGRLQDTLDELRNRWIAGARP
ncbi:MAG: cytochrome c biogenesis protein CcsA [Myxococcales bacterium]|nr:cytochrome c biogenesis protein CcsA [Myxococcales bacterium]